MNACTTDLLAKPICEALDRLALPRVAQLHHVHPDPHPIPVTTVHAAKDDAVTVVGEVEVEGGARWRGLRRRAGVRQRRTSARLDLRNRLTYHEPSTLLGLAKGYLRTVQA